MVPRIFAVLFTSLTLRARENIPSGHFHVYIRCWQRGPTVHKNWYVAVVTYTIRQRRLDTLPMQIHSALEG